MSFERIFGNVSTIQQVRNKLLKDAAAARATLQVPIRNVLINGDFRIWQAGTSFAGVSTSLHVADMSAFGVASQGTWTVERSTDVPSVEVAGRQLNYALKATVTTADATVDAGDIAHLVVNVEGYDYAPLYQQTQTVRFWAMSNRTGTYCVSLRNGAADRSYVSELTIDAADTWEEKTVTVTAAPDGTWDFTNGVGLFLGITLATGSTFQTTAGAWQSGNFIATTNQVNLADTLNNYIAVADVRLVSGGDASNIVIPSIAEQLAMCQRYYEASYDLGVKPGTVTNKGVFGHRQSGANIAGDIPFKVRKRATPTTSFYNPVTGASGSWRDTNAEANVTAVSLGGTGLLMDNDRALGFVCTASDGNFVQGHWVADARL